MAWLLDHPGRTLAPHRAPLSTHGHIVHTRPTLPPLHRPLSASPSSVPVQTHGPLHAWNSQVLLPADRAWFRVFLGATTVGISWMWSVLLHGTTALLYGASRWVLAPALFHKEGLCVKRHSCWRRLVLYRGREKQFKTVKIKCNQSQDINTKKQKKKIKNRINSAFIWFFLTEQNQLYWTSM